MSGACHVRSKLHLLAPFYETGEKRALTEASQIYVSFKFCHWLCLDYTGSSLPLVPTSIAPVL